MPGARYRSSPAGEATAANSVKNVAQSCETAFAALDLSMSSTAAKEQ
jgi:hypothetical protein